jgi:uncharacterized protein YqjF (DUF2071 family)
VHAPVAHEAWPLYEAEVLEVSDELISSHGLTTPTEAPRALWSPGVHVRIGRPTVVAEPCG